MSESGFADRLRALRESVGLSQYALAKKSGLTKQALSRLELGEREPTWQTVQLLAQALGVDCTAFTDPQLQAPAEQPAKPRGRPRKTDTATGAGQVEREAPPAKKRKRKK